jgi:hypothetical protein
MVHAFVDAGERVVAPMSMARTARSFAARKSGSFRADTSQSRAGSSRTHQGNQLEPIQEVVESDESVVILCWRLIRGGAPMWKPKHRIAADRSGLRYPSDLTLRLMTCAGE